MYESHEYDFKNAELNGEPKKESVICIRADRKNLSLEIIICHQLVSLMMPKNDLWDRFFYLPLTLLIDSYNMMH